MDLTAYYAENRRRSEIADQEFAARTHGWVFGLSPAAATWAPAWAAGRLGSEDEVSRLVRAADRAGLLVKPEAGEIRVAFASRDPETEVTTGVGFGFWPASARYLVVHASGVLPYTALSAMSTYGVLEAVVESFGLAHARYTQA